MPNRILGNPSVDWALGINSGSNEFVVVDNTTGAGIVSIAQYAPADSLVIGADGRIGLGTMSPAADLDVWRHLRGTTFQSASSRELKTGFETVDLTEILARLGELPVTSWRCKDDGEGAPHIGPVAEDFQPLFGLGDGETIANVDAVGVLMASVQGLRREMESRGQLIVQLNARLTALEARLGAK